MPKESRIFSKVIAYQEEEQRVRGIGEKIKKGIDLQHVSTMQGLVELFEIALDRAKRERDLDHALSESPTKPPRPGGWEWLRSLF